MPRPHIKSVDPSPPFLAPAPYGTSGNPREPYSTTMSKWATKQRTRYIGMFVAAACGFVSTYHFLSIDQHAHIPAQSGAYGAIDRRIELVLPSQKREYDLTLQELIESGECTPLTWCIFGNHFIASKYPEYAYQAFYMAELLTRGKMRISRGLSQQLLPPEE